MTNVVLSFDDGRGDNAEVAFNVLAPREIPATFNITTGYIDRSCPEDLSPSNNPPLTIDDVKKIAANPIFEIALHGDKHLNTIDDIYIGRDKILKWLDLPSEQKFGFASPGSRFSPTVFNSDEMRSFRSSIAYMRVSLRINKHMFFRVMCRKAARLTHLPSLFKVAYKETLLDKQDGQILYSVPVMKSTSFKEIKSLVDYAIRKDKSLVLMFHSIKDNLTQEDNWTWSKKRFERLCKYLELMRNEKQLCVCTSMDLIDRLA